MAVGFAITFLLGGFALNALFTGGFQRMPVKNRLYLVLLSVTMALSMITFGPRSFQSQDDPWQFNREWLLTLLTCAFISFVSSLRLRAFLWTLLGLGLVGLVQVPAYLHTSMGANVSASMVLGVFAAVFLFTNPWVTVAISTPLIIGTLILMKEGAVVGLMVGGFTLLLLRTRGTRLSWLPYLGATAVVAAGVAVWVAIGNARLWDQILHRGMDVRLEVYRDFLRLWLDSPIIGLWQVSPAVPRPADMYAGVPGPIYAHNPILEALGSWGLVGLALWASLQAIAAMAAHRTQLLPLWAAALAFAMSSGDLAGNPRYWIVGAVAVAVAISGLPVRQPPGAWDGQERGHRLKALFILNEPTPYFSPDLDQLANSLSLDTIYCEDSPSAQGWGRVKLDHPHHVVGNGVAGAARVIWLLLRNDYDAIVSFSFRRLPRLATFLFARLTGTPLVVRTDTSILDVEQDSAIKRCGRRLVMQRFIPRNTRIWTIGANDSHSGARSLTGTIKG